MNIQYLLIISIVLLQQLEIYREEMAELGTAFPKKKIDEMLVCLQNIYEPMT
jgi:hypothetical protein